jgi:hypothetical protein
LPVARVPPATTREIPSGTSDAGGRHGPEPRRSDIPTLGHRSTYPLSERLLNLVVTHRRAPNYPPCYPGTRNGTKGRARRPVSRLGRERQVTTDEPRPAQICPSYVLNTKISVISRTSAKGAWEAKRRIRAYVEGELGPEAADAAATVSLPGAENAGTTRVK